MHYLQLIFSFLLVLDGGDKLPPSFVILKKDQIQTEWIRKDQVSITFPFVVKKGYYLQSNQVKYNHLIASRIKFKPGPQLVIKKKEFLVNAYTYLHLDGGVLPVIEGDFKIKVHIQIKHPSSQVLSARFFYQACSKNQCFFPRALDFAFHLKWIKLVRGKHH